MTLADRLRSGGVLHLRAQVSHARRGSLHHAFRYGVDYLLFAPDHMCGLRLFSHNRTNLFAFHDRDHGGLRGEGRGASWAWEQFAAAGIARAPDLVMAFLTQPRFLGHWFTPVSFWMLLRGDALVAAIAEVNNTFGQRHSYLCSLPGGAAIGASDEIRADKVFHVSPFQDVAGEYRFRFALTPERLAIRIRQIDGANGLEAAMAGALVPLTDRALIGAALRRPGGSLRVLALIYWHALRLKLKGARYRHLPQSPDQEIS